MSPLSSSAPTLLQTYDRIVTSGPDAYGRGNQLRPLPSEDLEFHGALAGHHADAAVQGVAGLVATVQRIEVLSEVHDGARSAVLYDAVMPGGTVRSAEFSRTKTTSLIVFSCTTTPGPHQPGRPLTPAAPMKEVVMTEERHVLADRVRAALPQEKALREVSMFGGLSFMLDDRMVVAVNGDGSLLVRVDPARSTELLSLPDAAPAVMGAARPMGPGWITVNTNGLVTDRQLTDWIAVALQHHSSRAAP